MARRLLAAFTAALAFVAAASGAPAQEAAYTLGSMDKVRVRIVEWQSAEATLRDWSSISGDYTVSPSGRLSVPIVGELEVAGRTTAEVAEEIGAMLQQKLGLMDRPEAAVELAEFRPFYISGDVATPGRYAFEPNLTVLKAVSVAGGIKRSDASGQRIERDFIRASGDRAVLAAQRLRLLAKRARLRAEMNRSETISFPPELTESKEGRQIAESERAFRESRAEQLEMQLEALEDLKRLLKSEIASLEKKIATQNEQIELARDELAGIGDLADRGLVVNERVRSVKQTIADLEGRVLDMETAALRARQDIAQAEQDATALRNERNSDIAQELQQTEAELEAAGIRMLTENSLMQEALALAPESAESLAGSDPIISYTIVREREERIEEIAAEENTAVDPGDVVKVDIEPAPGQ